MTWATFWGIFLFTSLAGFAILAIVITVTGFREAMHLLRTTPSSHQRDQSQPGEQSSSD